MIADSAARVTPAPQLEAHILFRVVPVGTERAVRARSLINKKAVCDLQLLLSEFERATGADLSHSHARAAAVDSTQLLDPSFHSSVDLALRSMEEGNTEMARRCLNWVAVFDPQFRGPTSLGPVADHLSTRHGLVQMGIAPSETLQFDDCRYAKSKRSSVEIPGSEAIQAARALEMLRESAPLLHQEIILTTARISLIESSEFFGASHRSTFGEIFIATPPAHIGDPLTYYTEHLVHESAHNLLFSLLTADPLVLNDLEDKYEAPLRSDKRPIYGIFHATFVLARMMDAFRLLQCRLARDDVHNQFRSKLQKGVQVLRRYATLTEVGSQMLDEMENQTFLK